MEKPEEQSQHEAKTFEVARQTLLLEGTSGAPEQPARQAEGRPVRHDLTISGQSMLATGTSGPSTFPLQTADGRGVCHEVIVGTPSAGPGNVATTTAPSSLSGMGQLMGQPTRIS